MLEITNTQVSGLINSVLASGYAMMTEPYAKPLSEYTEDSVEFQKGINRLKRLNNASLNTKVKCHNHALCGITVDFDIKYPQYITPELQRYKFLDIITSSSKMHKLLKMDLDVACNELVSQEAIDNLRVYINQFNIIKDNNFEIFEFTTRTGKIIIKGAKECLDYAWSQVLSNTPMGLELFMRCKTNYLCLQNIYYQRKDHKLFEWRTFCDWIESLPYARTLILGFDD